MSEFRRRLLAKKDNGELKENEILAVYDVTTTESATKLLGTTYIAFIEKMYIEDNKITPTNSYIFDSIGVKYVRIKVNTPYLNSLFLNCTQLIECDLSNLNITKTISGQAAFSGCANLKQCKLPSTQLLRVFNSFFKGCKLLQSIPFIDTINGIDMNYFISGCRGITEISSFYLSNANTVQGTFSSLNVTSIPKLNMSKATNGSHLFHECRQLISIDLIDLSNCNSLEKAFITNTKLKHLEGIVGLKCNVNFSNSPLTPLSVHNLITNAAGNFTLILQSTAKTNWQNSEYYNADQAMATEKLITIQ